MIRGSTIRKHDTELLIAETEVLVRAAAAQMERLRANILQVRALEMQRQLVLGRLRQTLETGDRNTPATDPLAAPVVVAVVIRDERDIETLPEMATLH